MAISNQYNCSDGVYVLHQLLFSHYHGQKCPVCPQVCLQHQLLSSHYHGQKCPVCPQMFIYSINYYLLITMDRSVPSVHKCLYTASIIMSSSPWTEVSRLSTNVYIQHQLLCPHYHGQKCPVCPQMFIYSINYYLLIIMDRSVLSVHKCLYTASIIIFSLPWTEVSCLSTNVYIQHQLLSSHYHGQKCPVCPQLIIYSINYYLLITMDRSVLSVHKCLYTASIIIFSLSWTEVSCLSTNVYIQHQLLSSHYHGQKCPVCPQMFIYSINYYLLITMDRSVLSVHN